MDTQDRTDRTDEGVSVLEAAAALGLSEKTIYRRIKAGKLNATKRRTTTGYEWRVHLDQTGGQVDTPPASTDQQTAVVLGHGLSGPSTLELSTLWEQHEQLAVAYGRVVEENRALKARVEALDKPPWWRRWYNSWKK